MRCIMISLEVYEDNSLLKSYLIAMCMIILRVKE
jgi:hypothetical protein